MRTSTIVATLGSTAAALALTTQSAAGADRVSNQAADPVSPHSVTAPTARPHDVKYAAMNVSGFDPTVAKRHGYRIVRLSDGTRASIAAATYSRLGAHPSDAAVRRAASTTYDPATHETGGATERTLVRQRAAVASAQGVSPANTVYGNCGDSFYYISASGATWSSLTGYDIRDAADDFSWKTELSNPDGNVIAGTEYGDEPTGTHWEGYDNDPPYMTLDDTSDGVIWYGTWRGAVAYGEAYLVDGTVCISGDPFDATDN